MHSYNLTASLDSTEWDRYVDKTDRALFSHRYNWIRTLARTYDLEPYYLAAIENTSGKISGILPLLLFNPPLQPARLISLPYSDNAGIVGDTEESCLHLHQGAVDLADKLGADIIEYRQAGPSPGVDTTRAPGWNHTAYDFKTGLVRKLPETADELWRTLGAKVRNQVRKARKSDTRVRIGGKELTDDFYGVIAENMRDLGSPVHAPDLFRSLMDSMTDMTAIVVVYLEGMPAAAAFVLYLSGTLYNPWASSLRRCRPGCPNMLLYWSMMEYALSRGCRRFDFGRSSPEAATCRFKRQWGAVMEPLVWHVFSREGTRWDPRMESLENEAWKRMELKKTLLDGPTLRRWISL